MATIVVENRLYQVPVVIIGAGAAGLAAAKTLTDKGIRAVVLEARNRLGGRVNTDYSLTDFPLELGAEFIHGDETEASTHRFVKDASLNVIPVHRTSNMWWSESPSEPAKHRSLLAPHIKEKIDRIFALYSRLAEPEYAYLETEPARDVSLKAYLISHGITSESDLVMADVLLARPWCTSSEELSCTDLRRDMLANVAPTVKPPEPLVEKPTETKSNETGAAPKDPNEIPMPPSTPAHESRIAQGYSAMFHHMAKNVLIRYETFVTDIEYGQVDAQGNPIVRVSGSDSEGTVVYECAFCIVTVPQSVLQREVIHFDPPLPARKLEAITIMKMKPATKFLFMFRESGRALWDQARVTFLAHRGNLARWWTTSYGRQTRTPVIAAFLTAQYAEKVDAMTNEQAISFAKRELAALLGVPVATIKEHLKLAKRVSWALDPLAGGGYASVTPGNYWAREELARPVATNGINCLFFGGEASAYHSNPQTVHGALDTGIRTAQEVMSARELRHAAGKMTDLQATSHLSQRLDLAVTSGAFTPRSLSSAADSDVSSQSDDGSRSSSPQHNAATPNKVPCDLKLSSIEWTAQHWRENVGVSFF